MKSAPFDLLWLFPEINSVPALYQLITSASTTAVLLITGCVHKLFHPSFHVLNFCTGLSCMEKSFSSPDLGQLQFRVGEGMVCACTTDTDID